MIEDYDELCATRTKRDADIERLAARIDDAWLNEDLTWFSGAANREVRLRGGCWSPISLTPRPTTVARRTPC
jgi:hypothetical protein